MFNSYIFKNNTLYIDLNFNYEFGSNKNENNSIKTQINNLISKLNIKDKLKKIILTCNGLIIGTIIFLSNSINISNDNIKYVPNINDNVIVNKIDTSINDNEIIIENQNVNEITMQNDNNNEISYNYNHNFQNINQTNNQNSIENQSDYIETKPSVSNNTIVTIYRSNGNIVNIELEDYIIGVIAAEMPASFNNEAIKTQAVASRTYALKSINEGKRLTDTVSTQSYIDEYEMRNKWGSSFDYYYNKIKDAVYSTKGEYLTYNGAYIEALYHSTNNGKTESSLDVFGYYYPYLVSVSSEYDKIASSYLREITMDINTVSSKLGLNLTNDSIIEILSYTDGNNIKEINIDGKIFTGRNIRELLGIRSADFDININNSIVTITTRGFGHGVGMSQYGSNGMANAGYNYKDILYHYYPGSLIDK